MFSLFPGGKSITNEWQSKSEMLILVQRSGGSEEDLTHLLKVYVPDIALSTNLHSPHF